ncbi:hypothetical protein DVH24_032773 [Malus domestica]|uniref:Uncharacterized protein n=1 Tax=Malus domestica TaxID=3750 RepID=A0A498IMV1_MALDO|nr:hypothetical protein DVH24_032773 [Malus domestica]
MKCPEFEHEMPGRPPSVRNSDRQRGERVRLLSVRLKDGLLYPCRFILILTKLERIFIGLLMLKRHAPTSLSIRFLYIKFYVYFVLRVEGNIGELIYSLIVAISNDLVNPIILLLEQFKECFSLSVPLSLGHLNSLEMHVLICDFVGFTMVKCVLFALVHFRDTTRDQNVPLEYKSNHGLVELPFLAVHPVPEHDHHRSYASDLPQQLSNQSIEPLHQVELAAFAGLGLYQGISSSQSQTEAAENVAS